jgi:hemolysin activation/secretion protein
MSHGVMRRAVRSSIGTIAAVALAALWTAAAGAQPVERNLPPVQTAPQTSLAEPALPGSIDDDRSLGARLIAVVLLGPKDRIVRSTQAPGLYTLQVTRMNTADARDSLRGFLGQPISRKLIGDIETQIVLHYRAEGFPFVEVSTPEQEITRGVLQIRVVEFRVSRISVAHAGKREVAYIEGRIRTQPGDEIDSAALSQDIDWLNRFPARTVSPAFTPGARLGQTELDLTVSHSSPWDVNAGYSNSGSPLTGENRVFVGASLAGHLVTDETFSIQVTGSPDFWSLHGKPFDNPNPLYESAAARLQIATAPRQDIELTADAVETNEVNGVFVGRQQTLEMNLGYRSALSNIVALPGDISGGVELSHQARSTLFGGVSVVYGAVNIYQFYGDWSDHWSDRFGSTSLDLSAHGSPGSIDDLNTSAALSAFTSGQVKKASYVYGQANITRQTELPFGTSLVTQLTSQYAGTAIPESQEIALGGPTAVRGYTIDDGAWDDGAVLRDELHGLLLPLGANGSAGLGTMMFVDYGFGRSDSARRIANEASVGLGADLHVGTLVLVSGDVCSPLINGQSTRSGRLHLDVRVSMSY